MNDLVWCDGTSNQRWSHSKKAVSFLSSDQFGPKALLARVNLMLKGGWWSWAGLPFSLVKKNKLGRCTVVVLLYPLGLYERHLDSEVVPLVVVG